MLVRTRNEEPEVLRQRQEAVKNKSVSDLAAINSFSDFPLPKFGKNRSASRGKERSRSASPSGPKDVSLYGKLPSSLKSELLVKTVEDDPEVTKQRQELCRSMSPAQLGEIRGLGDFPVPDAIENLLAGYYDKSPIAWFIFL